MRVSVVSLVRPTRPFWEEGAEAEIIWEDAVLPLLPLHFACSLLSGLDASATYGELTWMDDALPLLLGLLLLVVVRLQDGAWMTLFLLLKKNNTKHSRMVTNRGGEERIENN